MLILFPGGQNKGDKEDYDFNLEEIEITCQTFKAEKQLEPSALKFMTNVSLLCEISQQLTTSKWLSMTVMDTVYAVSMPLATGGTQRCLWINHDLVKLATHIRFKFLWKQPVYWPKQCGGLIKSLNASPLRANWNATGYWVTCRGHRRLLYLPAL